MPFLCFWLFYKTVMKGINYYNCSSLFGFLSSLLQKDKEQAMTVICNNKVKGEEQGSNVNPSLNRSGCACVFSPCNTSWIANTQSLLCFIHSLFFRHVCFSFSLRELDLRGHGHQHNPPHFHWLPEMGQSLFFSYFFFQLSFWQIGPPLTVDSHDSL